MRMNRKFFIIMMIITLSFSLSLPAGAEGETSPNVRLQNDPSFQKMKSVEGFELSSLGVRVFDPSRYIFLNDGYRGFSSPVDGNVNVYCTTLANYSINQIGCTLKIMKWTGSSWVQQGQDYGVTHNDASSVSASYIVALPRGYSYRLDSVHWGIKAGDKESYYAIGSQFNNP